MSGGITSWEGRRVLVTGASSGIGAAIARELAAHGAVVGICARRAALLESVLDECRRHVPACRAWTIDLSRVEGLEAFAPRVEHEFGGIDVLVNNAGESLTGDATSTGLDQLEAQLRINYLSPVLLTLAALPGMHARGGGHIVTISSMAARMSTPGEAAYAAAKAALTAYIEALAGELWDTPIRSRPSRADRSHPRPRRRRHTGRDLERRDTDPRHRHCTRHPPPGRARRLRALHPTHDARHRGAPLTGRPRQHRCHGRLVPVRPHATLRS